MSHLHITNYSRYISHYITKIFSRSLFTVFIPVYLFANGFSLFQVGLFYLIQDFFTFTFSAFLFKRIHILGVRNATILGVLAQALLVFTVYNFLSVEYALLVLFAFLRGFHDGFYWGAFSVFIVHTSGKKTGHFFGKFNFITAISLVVVIPLVGFLLDNYSPFWLVTLSIIICLLSILPILNLNLKELRKNKEVSFADVVKKKQNRFILIISHLNELFVKINDSLIVLYVYFLFTSYFSVGIVGIFVKLGEALYSYAIGNSSDNNKWRKRLVFANILGYLFLLASLVFVNAHYILYVLITGLAFFRLGSWIATEAGINKRIKPEYECAKKMIGRLGENVAGMIIGLLVMIAGLFSFKSAFIVACVYVLIVSLIVRTYKSYI